MSLFFQPNDINFVLFRRCDYTNSLNKLHFILSNLFVFKFLVIDNQQLIPKYFIRITNVLRKGQFSFN